MDDSLDAIKYKLPRVSLGSLDNEVIMMFRVQGIKDVWIALTPDDARDVARRLVDKANSLEPHDTAS